MYPGVESLSGNVKMGLQMKMKRGELVGFNGCFGYDMYLQGIGSGTIAKRLVELGIKNKRGTVEWHDHGVMGMIKMRSIKVMCFLERHFHY